MNKCNHQCNQGRDCDCGDNSIDMQVIFAIFILSILFVVLALIGLVNLVRWLLV